ncbi:MAG: PAS domain-containing protein [SAR324 cluster bacterium]|nr:PAS domain-containing protein [SAR324 cluster bacterium]
MAQANQSQYNPEQMPQRKRALNNLKSRLILIIGMLLLIMGVTLYTLAQDSLRTLRLEHIKESFKLISSTIHSFSDQYLDAIQTPDGFFEQKKQQARALSVIKNFVEANQSSIVIYEGDSGVVLMDNFGIGVSYVMTQDQETSSLQMLTQNGTQYYFYHFFLPSSNWHVILLKTSPIKTGFQERFRQASMQTIGFLILATFLLLYYLRQLVNNPVDKLIHAVKTNQIPRYQGIYEFEFLSQKIAEFMNTLQTMKNQLSENTEAHEITRRELFNNNQTLEFFFKNFPFSIVFFTPEMKILRCNKASINMFGYKMDDLLGTSPSRLYESETDLQKHLELWQVAQTIGPMETIYTRNDKTTFIGETTGITILDRNQHRQGFLLVIRDVTLAKKQEEERLLYEEKLEKQVSERTHELEKVNAQLKHQQKSLEEHLYTQQEISDNLLHTASQLKTAQEQQEQQNAMLIANNRKLEELNENKEHLLSKLSYIYASHLTPLQNQLDTIREEKSFQQNESLRQAMREVSAIEELLRPIHQLYSSEKAIKSKQVLVAETNKKQQLITKQALGGTGVELTLVSNMDEGIELLRQRGFDIICTNTELIELASIAQDRYPHIKTVFMTSDDVPTYLPILNKYPFISNIVSRNDEDRTFTIKNILTTVSKLIGNDLFGLEKYMNWGVEVHQQPIIRSDQRTELLDKMEQTLVALGIRKTTLNRCIMVAEELLMNAIYDAPVDSSGKFLYNHLSRTDAVELKHGEQGIFRFAFDGILLAVSAQDPFGSFDRQTILDYLARCYAGVKDTSRKGKGGAGKGLFQILESSDLLVINVKPGIKTEVIALFNVNSDLTHKVPSFHYFYI